MGELQLVLSVATESDHGVILGLIQEAADWLRAHKDTDQWARPWPDRQRRDQRIMRDLRAGKTWLALHGAQVTATVTVKIRDEEGVWPQGLRGEPAVYVSRLVVDRRYAGRRVGARLIDWVALQARHQYQARWVRVGVWTTNMALHDYYLGQGFGFCGFCDSISGYPAAALFQKPTERAKPASPGSFRVAARTRAARHPHTGHS